jgi:hypothetical protein
MMFDWSITVAEAALHGANIAPAAAISAQTPALAPIRFPFPKSIMAEYYPLFEIYTIIFWYQSTYK